ncbi:hypothetical protein J6590_099647 [Homalodisca vitripennis]|nr:hypothetical protein J6590_099647 [Homalodisca vitripennis]
MKSLLFVLLLLRDSLATPTIEDNKIPTPQEVLGQPEEVSSLGLPSDEESFNRLSVFFNPPKQSSNVGSGTYHFVSSTFPVVVTAENASSEHKSRVMLTSVLVLVSHFHPCWCDV